MLFTVDVSLHLIADSLEMPTDWCVQGAESVDGNTIRLTVDTGDALTAAAPVVHITPIIHRETHGATIWRAGTRIIGIREQTRWKLLQGLAYRNWFRGK